MLLSVMLFTSGDFCCHLHVGNVRVLYFLEHNCVKKSLLWKENDYFYLFVVNFSLYLETKKTWRTSPAWLSAPYRCCLPCLLFWRWSKNSFCGADKTLQVNLSWEKLSHVPNTGCISFFFWVVPHGLWDLGSHQLSLTLAVKVPSPNH